jgi:hypothetical protein
MVNGFPTSDIRPMLTEGRGKPEASVALTLDDGDRL